MRKVLFTESQIRKIFESEGLDNGLDVGGGYLAPDDGGEEPDNATNDEVFVDPTNPTMDGSVVTGDRAARELNPRRAMFGFGTKYSSPVVEEDIEQEKFTYNRIQKADAANTGTKMGQNIATQKNVSNGTQRKRKHDLKIQQNKLSKEEFEKRYGPIVKTIATSLTQMSNSNKAKNSSSDLDKLNNVNDATKVKTGVGKGHHKDGEELNNGILHYYN